MPLVTGLHLDIRRAIDCNPECNHPANSLSTKRSIRQIHEDLLHGLAGHRGYLSLLPPSVGFLFVFDFVQELLAHPCRPPSGFIPWYSTKQIPEEAKVCSPEIQGSELAMHPPRCPKDLELHHFMVTAAKATLELHIPHQLLLVGEKKVQHSTSSCWLLYHLKKEIIINTFQEPPRLLMSCCVVPPTDIGLTQSNSQLPPKISCTLAFIRSCCDRDSRTETKRDLNLF
ncbi:hypothetical protein QYF61_015603 [Mycteria americana]|uniref:Uncharacterized protein n=1 Tax=Mycteria americana TaxID=33587 RepID=A0AAN7NUQ3_MYCAM|nr:hypothetical protein QYF61_015603 [Mycteria americana]